jgi:hypothetical protein
MPRLTLRLPGVFAPIALALALFGATGFLPSTMSTASAADGDGNTRRALKLDEGVVRYLVTLYEHELGAPKLSDEELASRRRASDDDDDDEE